MVIKHLRRLAIEPEDEAAHDLEALRLQGVHRMERIVGVVLAHILLLFSGEERGRGRGLNAHKDGGKPRLPHGLHELVVLNEIHTGFRTEGKGIVACALPGDEGPEQAQCIPPIADEVIIHKKDTPTPA